MSKLENIHDNFFKKVFSDKQNVRDFLKITLPESFKTTIDFKKIAIDVTSYVSDVAEG